MKDRGGRLESAGIAPAERALSFISKSLLDVQNSANRDLKLMRQRAKSFRDLATTLDKELESFKIPSLSLDSVGSGSVFSKIKDSGSFTALPILPLPTISAQRENSDFLKKFKPNLSGFRRVSSDPNLSRRQTDDSMVISGTEISVHKSVAPKESNGDWGLASGQQWRRGVTRKSSSPGDQFLSEVKKIRSRQPQAKLDEWEPLRRVKESFKDLESTAASSKSPSEFFENVKKTEFYENVKKNLKITPRSTFGAKDDNGNIVAPLDVPELLENLVRQSEPLLGQLGVQKDVSEKVCEMLRSYKRKEIRSDRKGALVAAKDSAKAVDNLDLRIASVVQSTGYRYKGGFGSDCSSTLLEEDDDRRNIAIVTTASLPWMTGTAVNPLFRAAYLAKFGKQKVTLLVPWLSQKDQELVYPNRLTFASPAEQESYVRNWLESRVGFKADFKIAFYPGKFSTEKRSILAAGDISRFIPDNEADVAVLEEPEHLSWYYHGKRWTDKFQHVVGVVHTNYLEYVKREKNGPLQAFILEHVNNWMVRIYCNKVLRLSGATQMLPKSTICNVHGVSPKYLDIGDTVSGAGGGANFTKGAYFLGKMIWGKGYRELADLLALHKEELGDVKLDVYGNGEDSAEVEATAMKLGLPMNFHRGRDHADELIHGYKVFINPSISDVVCTTTAEALAMGKNVVCADHPSNEFFRSFPNCYTYKTSAEFVEKVKQAMAAEPVPLSQELRHLLSWEAATDRFIACAELDKLPPKSQKGPPSETMEKKKIMSLSMSAPNLSEVVDRGLAFTHFFFTGMQSARDLFGALPDTMHIDAQHCKDLGLPSPSVERLVYGW